MSFWRMLLSGLRRQPKEHMPWLRDIGERQRELKADVAMTRRDVEAQARYYRMQHEGSGR